MRPDQLKDYLRNKMKTALQQSMTVVANEGVNWVKDRFRNQNWLDAAPQPWQPRKKNAKNNIGRALLVGQTRVLSRNNKYENIKATGFLITNRTPYAGVHNWGGTITRHARSERFIRNRSKRGKFKKGISAGRGFTFKGGSTTMPQRQFAGNSANLRMVLARKAQIEMTKRMQ